MKFVVPGSNVKLLGKAIHCLAKIGDDVYLEPTRDSLALRTVNSSRSAYATFNFGSSFFSVIEQTRAKGDSMEEDRCKVMVRSLLLAFRSLSVLEKTVDSCILETGQDCKLLISLNCRHSVTKQFSVGLVECEALRAVYDITRCTNRWIIQAKVMQEANGNFLANQEEVTMHVGLDSFKMKNYNDDYDEKKQVHTELAMQPGEFEQFKIVEEASITFCLKELRSLLMFAEYLQLPISANFSQGGQPMVLTVSQGQAINCTYVLATLADQGEGQECERIPTTTTSTAYQDTASTNISQAGHGRLHSTQRDTPVPPTCPTLSPNLSTIPMEMPPSLHPTLDNSMDLRPPDSDCMEGTPPTKRKNFMFRRCFDATFNPHTVPGTEKVLAPDSDEEM
eukprot:GFUD01126847.1.p1 GENE.GFUD01126847.1~~GFUD01126847.1.p1  ORF type:complete len:393 (-),score=161.67 GFUD01126847.1:126-1304(-)